uniref:Calx-beta domain-containing protein n=1 Tax=Spongiimicrobium sp. 3-5 TaxID=3332596 RepID=UPI00397FEBA1
IGINGDTATGNITDNDGGAGNGISFDSNDVTVDEGAGTATFRVRLTGNVQGGFTVDYATSDGSAAQPGDYTAASGRLTFAGTDDESHDITVTIIDDDIIELTENFTVTLSDLSTALIGINGDTATGNITDNDGGAGNGISFDSNDVTVDEGAGTATFRVRLTGNVQGGFTVDYATSDGSAAQPGDYTAASGRLTFAGTDDESHDITVTIIDDDIIELTENFTVTLSDLSTALIGINGDTATGNITDNDGGAGNGISFDSNDVTVDEGAGTATFRVRLTGNVQGGFTVDYATSDGSAAQPGDYTATTGQLSFAGTDDESHDITVTIIDDVIVETTESYLVNLSNLSTNVIGINGDQATGNITDNDSESDFPGDITVNCDEIPIVPTITLNSTGCAYSEQFEETITGQDDGCDTEYTITRTWTITDCASNVRIHAQIITVEDNEAPTFVESLPGDTTVSCDNIPQAVVLTAIDNCDSNASVTFDEQITDTDSCGSDYIITRTWTAMDCANNPTVHVQTITVEDTEAPTFVETLPTDITVSCDAVPQAAVLTAIDNCDSNASVTFDEQITDTDSCGSDYIITRTWTAMDCANNPTVHVQTITVEDTEAPTFVETLPTDITVSCDAVPQAAVLTAIDNCDSNASVTFDEQITDTDSCGSDYTITRTWTAMDCANNPTVHVQTITVEDVQAPSFVETLPQNMTVLCNEVPDAVTLTAMDNCDADVSVTFDETITNNANCALGYTVTRIWSTEDCAGNVNAHTQVITIETTGPITASGYDEEITITCGDEIPEVPQPIFMGGCGNYNVDFSEDTVFSDDTDDYMIIRTWEVTDSCDNTASFEQIIFVMQPQLEEITIEICVEDDAIDLVNYLPADFDTNGVFEVINGNVVLQGSIFDPTDLEVGEYLISYASTEGTCKYYADITIVVNSDCVPCGRNQIQVSRTVTANGDGINDMFEITGVEYCNYTFDVMIFNRWGDKVFEAVNYENGWGGFAPNNSFGDSGMLPAGTYYYLINVRGADFEPVNGYIYLGTSK